MFTISFFFNIYFFIILVSNIYSTNTDNQKIKLINKKVYYDNLIFQLYQKNSHLSLFS